MKRRLIKKRTTRHQKTEKLLVAGVILTIILIIGIVTFHTFFNTSNKSVVLGESTEDTNLFSLQMKTFNPPTPAPVVPAPAAGNTCPPDTPVGSDNSCACPTYEVNSLSCNSQDICNDAREQMHNPNAASVSYCTIFSTSTFYGQNYPGFIGSPELYEKYKDDPKCQRMCWGKPVIYLYPAKDTVVNVKLEVPGSIIVSDPLYPKGGWNNVLAHPDGTFVYAGKTYHELFYESSVNKRVVPEEGIIIPSEKLQQTLTDLTGILGLVPTEQQEFLDYWLPKLKALNSPYIFFSVLTPEQKDSIDHVEITPKPDTNIALLFYFKPIYHPSTIKPLLLPQNPPERKGFTSVEWGGTIDY